MTKELFLIASNQIMGRIVQDKQGNLKLIYEDAWRSSDASYPLSTSMPLSAKEHGNNIVSPWLTNLLPDNETIIAKWASRFQVSPRNAFALLCVL
ncbi:MAG: HipA N-terminal domain-containing protein [Alphaproteobacteria bacterium]